MNDRRQPHHSTHRSLRQQQPQNTEKKETHTQTETVNKLPL
jgi:hypothetical protein